MKFRRRARRPRSRLASHPFQPKRPMLKRNLWKILVSLALVAWAASELFPTQDTPFVDYARTHATAKQAEFGKLLDEASARKKANPLQTPSEFVALKQIGKERKLDLSQYFPNVRLE